MSNAEDSTVRAQRVAIKLQLEASGADLEGRDFIDQAWTKIVSPHGAAIVIDRSLAPEQTLYIKRVGHHPEAEVRVIGHIGSEATGEIYGVALLNPVPDIWGIDFPPGTADETLVKVLLECPQCHSRQVAALNEFELSVFEANGDLSRRCAKCRDVTFWKQSLYDALPEPGKPAEAPAPPKPAPEPRRPPANRRRQARVKVQLKGCILFYGQEMPIEVKDMSRGGICFHSPRSFAEGVLLRVAIPFTPGAANIFVPAKICWCRSLPSGLKECGLQYVKE